MPEEKLSSPVVFVGHSLGGAIALMAAARFPEMVKALIIEDTALTLENYKRIIESSQLNSNLKTGTKTGGRSRSI